MDCSGCEARREWIKKQRQNAAEKLRLLLQRLGAKSVASDDNTKRVDGQNL